MSVRLLLGDCREHLAAMPADSVDALVVDPPYELGFMGRAWDRSGVAFDPETWAHCLRVTKPGGHLVAFGGTRTVHRIACAIEDAGWAIRDMGAWTYYSGFPKSVNVSQNPMFCQCDATAHSGESTTHEQGTASRTGTGAPLAGGDPRREGAHHSTSTAPDSLADCQRGRGLGGAQPHRVTGDGQASPPSPRCAPERSHSDAPDGASGSAAGRSPSRARRSDPPSMRGSSLQTATGEACVFPCCLVCGNPKVPPGLGSGVKPGYEPWLLARKPLSESSIARNVLRWGTGALNLDACRFAPGDPMWPGPSEEVEAVWRGSGQRGTYGSFERDDADTHIGLHAAGRFPANLLYCPKASRAERELGCEGLPTKTAAEATHSKEGQARLGSPRTGAGRTAEGIRNHHPTVKPLHLMRYLVRLVTPPGGLVCDPFMGSGTTGMAAVGQGFRFVGCELEADHMQIARARIEHAASGRAVECDLADVRTPAVQVGLFATPA